MALLDFFGFGKAQQPTNAADTETVRKIVDALDRMEAERARYIAAFAYILSRVARADLSIGSDESRAMERTVAEHGNLPEEQAIIVVQIAKHQNLLFGATENFLVTREFAKIATQEQKLALLDCLISVAAAEVSISTMEDNEIRQIARELGLSHEEFISVRSRFRDDLAVLRKPNSDT